MRQHQDASKPSVIEFLQTVVNNPNTDEGKAFIDVLGKVEKDESVTELAQLISKPSRLNYVQDTRPWYERFWACLCAVADSVCNLICGVADLLRHVLDGLCAVVYVVDGALRVAVPITGAGLVYYLSGSGIVAAIVAAIAYKALG